MKGCGERSTIAPGERMGMPEDAAHFIVWLICGESYCVTRQVICATGNIGVM